MRRFSPAGRAWHGGSTRRVRICFFTVVCEMGWSNGRTVIASAEYLLTGGRLAQFDAWAGSTDLTLAPSEIDFLEDSREEAHRQRSRRRRRRNLITAGFGAAAVIAGVFAFSASRNAEIAESRELAASAINVLDEDPELSVLLALEAAGIADPPIESVSAIHESLAAHHKILTYQLPTFLEELEPFATLSPDGHLLATSGGGNYIEVVEVDSGERLWSREFAEGAIAGTAFSCRWLRFGGDRRMVWSRQVVH